MTNQRDERKLTQSHHFICPFPCSHKLTCSHMLLCFYAPPACRCQRPIASAIPIPNLISIYNYIYILYKYIYSFVYFLLPTPLRAQHLGTTRRVMIIIIIIVITSGEHSLEKSNQWPAALAFQGQPFWATFSARQAPRRRRAATMRAGHTLASQFSLPSWLLLRLGFSSSTWSEKWPYLVQRFPVSLAGPLRVCIRCELLFHWHCALAARAQHSHARPAHSTQWPPNGAGANPIGQLALQRPSS